MYMDAISLLILLSLNFYRRKSIKDGWIILDPAARAAL